MNDNAKNSNGSAVEGPLMTKEEVAMMLRKSKRTIEHWVNQGYLSCIRIGRSVLFDRDQVIRDIRHFQTSSTAETIEQ